LGLKCLTVRHRSDAPHVMYLTQMVRSFEPDASIPDGSLPQVEMRLASTQE